MSVQEICRGGARCVGGTSNGLEVENCINNVSGKKFKDLCKLCFAPKMQLKEGDNYLSLTAFRKVC